jgi:CRP/FNR family transcriptional regulator, cyclic AMP receptor protein
MTEPTSGPPPVDARALSRLHLFEGLPYEVVASIADCAHPAHAAVGEVLFREGEPADRFYVLLSGGVSLSVHLPGRGHEHIDTVRGGDVVGWSWLFPPYQWHFDGRVLVDSELLVVNGACVRGKCDADPRLGYLLMQRFAEVIHRRLQGTRLRLLDLHRGPDAR